MILRRGMIVAATTDPAIPHSPFLLVQSDLFNEDHATISACPLTMVAGSNHLFRVPLEPTDATGISVDCEIMADKVQMLPRTAIAGTIGTVPITTMTRVDDALRRWLEL